MAHILVCGVGIEILYSVVGWHELIDPFYQIALTYDIILISDRDDSNIWRQAFLKCMLCFLKENPTLKQ